MDKHSEALAARAAAGQDDADLPRYSSSSSTASLAPELTEHTFQLDDNKGRPWVWLTVKSRARDKKTWPLYYERDIINGIVEVDFDKVDGAKGVSVAVGVHRGPDRGRNCLSLRSLCVADSIFNRRPRAQITGGVTAVGQEELTFMTVSKDLWDTKVSGKAPKGKASWPFSLALPSEALTADKPKAKAQPYRLPPTFSGNCLSPCCAAPPRPPRLTPHPPRTREPGLHRLQARRDRPPGCVQSEPAVRRALLPRRPREPQLTCNVHRLRRDPGFSTA